jgi:energy-coupling factor transport system substrate-specific component
MNLHLWVTFSGDHTLGKLGFYFAGSFPFDVAHALGSLLFCLAFGPALVRALRRFRTRFEVDWRPAPAVAGAAVALLAVVGAAPPRADAAPPAAAVRYLERAQNPDGGFGPAPRAGSTPMHTGWAALGLAAAGRNPRDVAKGGRGVVDYMRANAARLRGDLGERSRTILALRAAGADPARIGGRDLVAELVAEQERDGSFARLVNTTAFAVLALRAAGRPASDAAVRRAAAYIAGGANRDGGFNFAGRGGASGADDTGAALQALAAAGRRTSRVTRRAARWLVRHQNADGGFSLQGGPSNAQSTAWAVQGLVAAGRDPATVRRNGSRSPIAYLRSLMGRDGAIRYSRTSTQTPVWVTAQALVALAGKAFPLAPARRTRAAAAAEPEPAPAATPAPTATPAPKPAQREDSVRAAAAVAAPAPAPAPPRLTPLAVVATALPAATPSRAHAAGVALAIVTRTLLP